MPTDDDRVSLIELDLPRAAQPTPAPAPNVRQAIPVAGLVQNEIARGAAPALATNQTVRELAEAERVAASERSRNGAMAAVGAFCACPLGSRPDAVNGACPACRMPRRIRGSYGPQTATVAAETGAVARALGVQTNTRTAGDVAAEILTPRETALREMREKLRTGHGATAAELRKWELMFASVTETVSANPNGYVRHTEVVAGAKTDASGIFTGFGGKGTLTRGELLGKLREAGMPEEWAMPAKSAHAQAGRVLQGLSHGGMIVRAARLNRADPQLASARARWTVGTANGGAGVGGAFGTTLLVVTLGADDRLVIEGDAGLGVRVRTEFEAAIRAEEYSATDVSSWLAGVLMNHFRAARVGGNWYIRKSYAADAERLLTVFSRGWGRDWLLPAIPMSTCEQLAAGLASNFIAEAEAVLATYCEELAEAQKHGEREIGSRRASTLHTQIRELAERASGYAMMLGDRHVAQLRTKLSAAANKIAESIDGLTQRFELIFDDLRASGDLDRGAPNASGPGR